MTGLLHDFPRDNDPNPTFASRSMQDRIQIKALRNCSIRVKWTDVENREIKDGWIAMDAGESRGDIQLVMALDAEYSDLPDEFDSLRSEGYLNVRHPTRVGETEVSYDTIALTRLA